ncbi:MAG: tRNA uridine-5-carboxymethylaminomethyl(34) synthesis GTPase MnmE, partial [Gammaproteobacteria bacterium]|nr:tRNA uridine-5-carboxymethylaminomethyl(34) synthesis GTPase MnmE [Gammaproteobacteria bacterium]
METSDGTVRDTIAAVATAPGVGGIGVVRISGPAAPIIASKITGRTLVPRTATYALFKDTAGDVIDSGVAVFFAQPNSYTGEDVLELQGHGGPVVLDMVLSRVIELGARPARAGEFSERAFLNQKIDLAQAEAVADLIDASSQRAAKLAQRSLQ